MAPGRCPTVHRNPPVNCSTNRNNVDINSGIDTQMLDQLIATRVAESLAAAAVTHAEFRAVMHENFRGTEGAVGLTRWFEKLESQFGISNVAEGDRVKFASSTLLYGALTWWNVYVRSVTLDTAHATPWSDFKAMFIRKWAPNADRLLECYIEGLPLNIKGNITSSNLVDLHEAIEMAQGLMYQVVQEFGENSGDKQKWNGNHYTHNPNNTSNLNPNKRPETARHKAKTPSFHLVPQTKEDQEAREDREAMSLVLDVVKKDTTRTSVQTMGIKAVKIKFKATRKIPRTIRGRIKGTLKEITKYQPALNEDEEHLAEYAAYVLKPRKYIDIPPTALDTNYSVELSDGKSLTTNTILRGCTLNLQNHLFKIDLLPIELGSFDVIVGMDWMAEHRAEVVCYEKYIRVSYGNDMLIVQGERSGVKNESRVEVISSIRTHKYIDHRCQVFLIQMMKEDKTEIPESEFEEWPFVSDFSEVFPKD
ncbi:putative reverse transcriptase domain-containing protein [Tanacetum coccineum]